MLKLVVTGCSGELNSFINDFLTDQRFEVHRLLADDTDARKGEKMIGADFQYRKRCSSRTLTVNLETKNGQMIPLELINDSSLKVEMLGGSFSITGKSYDIFSPPTIKHVDES